MTTMAGNPRSPRAAADALRAAADIAPQVAIVLGSGLGPVADLVVDPVVISYQDIPDMPMSAIPGHAGNVILGYISGVPVIVFSGRVHLYEGWSPTDVTFGVDVAAELGVSTFIATNAAGGVNPEFQVGQLMVIEDHINLLGCNPLVGPLPPDTPIRFVPMSRAYSAALRQKALEVGHANGHNVASGVYLAALGPTYETAAEVRMQRTLGADAVGMSTVPEVIRATWHGMDTLGLSTITNMATGIATVEHDHLAVARAAAAAADAVVVVIAGVCEHLASSGGPAAP